MKRNVVAGAGKPPRVKLDIVFSNGGGPRIQASEEAEKRECGDQIRLQKSNQKHRDTSVKGRLSMYGQ
jgi:hypothetical protein